MNDRCAPANETAFHARKWPSKRPDIVRNHCAKPSLGETLGLTLPSRQYGRPEQIRTEEKVGIPAPAFVLAQKDGAPTEGLNQVTKNSCQRLFQPVFAALDSKLSSKPSRNRRACAHVARASVAAIHKPRGNRSADQYDAAGQGTHGCTESLVDQRRDVAELVERYLGVHLA